MLKDEQITAAEALEELSPVFGAERAKAAIAGRLRAGKLAASARRKRVLLRLGDSGWAEVNWVDIPKQQQEYLRPAYKANVSVVPRHIWMRSPDWSRDVEQWDWDSSFFPVTIAFGPMPYQWVLEDVRFRSLDFCDASVFRKFLPQEEKAPTGLGRPKARDWDPVLIELIALAHERRLHEAMGHAAQGRKTRLKEWFERQFVQMGSTSGDTDNKTHAKMVVDRLFPDKPLK